MAFLFPARPRQACHVIANTEELPTIPIELSTKVSIGELVFHGGFRKPEKKSMGFRAMDVLRPKTTMGVKRAEIWNVFFFLRQRLIFQHDGLKLVLQHIWSS